MNRIDWPAAQLRRGIGLALLALAGLAPLPATAACQDAAHRQFDFWIGDWEVKAPATGKVVGINRIKADYGGCVLRERYEATSGYRGESFNVYDASRGRWHQTWVDNNGQLLLLEGGLRGENMVLEGRTTAADGKQKRHRISWTPRPDGSVTQLWESSDSDDQWSTVFYGVYRRK